MDTNVLRECLALAMSNRMTFPETVARMHDTGVERYDADLSRMEKRYYAGDGSTHTDPIPLAGAPAVPREFSCEGVRDAIQAIQRREIDYPEFLRRIMHAGTAGYTVYLEGRKAVYFGRSGDSHVEPFTPAN
ncbi:MAG: hypothetical protein U0835_08715 [Isosphaeraceae bacterium]